VIEGSAHRIFNPLGIETTAGIVGVPGRENGSAQRPAPPVRAAGDIHLGRRLGADIIRSRGRKRKIDLALHQPET
jgi:hypothetical protein